jgi:hypothetical protein
MAIGNVVQRGPFIYIYNENNKQTGAVSSGSGPNDGLKGYTPSQVNIQHGPFIYSYNESGQQVGAVLAN